MKHVKILLAAAVALFAIPAIAQKHSPFRCRVERSKLLMSTR